MGATFSRVKTWVAEILYYADLNAEFDNILNNLTPAGIDDQSTNAAAMQTTTDPYPGDVASLATSLQGELQRLRFLIAQITGETYWYIDPDTTIAAIHAILGAAGANVVLKSLYDAYSILYADTDNTPAALTVSASTIVGRKASGGIAALTGAEALALLNTTASRILGQKSSGDCTALTAAEVRNLLATAPFVVGSDADGDIWYRASGALARRAIGSEGQMLKVVSGVPNWATHNELNKSPTLLSIGMTSDHYWTTMAVAYTTLHSQKVYIPSGATYVRFSVYGQAGSSVGYFRLNIGALNSAGVSWSSESWAWKDVGTAFDVSSLAGSLVTVNLQAYNVTGDPQTTDFRTITVYLCSS